MVCRHAVPTGSPHHREPDDVRSVGAGVQAFATHAAVWEAVHILPMYLMNLL